MKSIGYSYRNTRRCALAFEFGGDACKWSDHAVKRILTHPKYKGTAVYNRTTERLRSKSRRVPASAWILVPNAFEPIIEPSLFDVAQETLRGKFWHRSNEEVLEQLKCLLKTHGYLSTALLRSHGFSPGGMNRRFGTLIHAYDLIGYQTPHRKTAEHRLHVRKIRSEFNGATGRHVSGEGVPVHVVMEASELP